MTELVNISVVQEGKFLQVDDWINVYIRFDFVWGFEFVGICLFRNFLILMEYDVVIEKWFIFFV